MDHRGDTPISSSSSPAIGSSHDPLDHFSHYPPLPLSSHDYPSAPNSVNGDVMSPIGRGMSAVFSCSKENSTDIDRRPYQSSALRVFPSLRAVALGLAVL